MQPTAEQPDSFRAHDHSAHEHGAYDRSGLGIADSLDHLLVWLDGLRDRRGFSTALAVAAGIAVALLWGIGQWSRPPDIDSQIPSILEREQVDLAPTAAAPAGTDVDPSNDDGLDTGAGSPVPIVEPPIVVHVSGAVVDQGLVELPPGSRLAEAIIAAGGETELADIHRLNLATPLVDGMHIRVPRRDEADSEATLPLIETAATGSGLPLGLDPVDGRKVNVNTGDAAELERLPGVGPAIAAAIVSWRDDNGRFVTVDDLLAVPGIGPAKLAAMEDQVGL